MDQEITLIDKNSADATFRSICLIALKMMALFLMVYYASHVGIIFDELLMRCFWFWCYGICRTLCVLCAIGVYTAWFQPDFEGILSLKGFKYSLPILLALSPVVIITAFRFEILSLDSETIIELVAVAVVEEMEFRGVVCSFGMKYVKKPMQIVPLAVLSGIFFGLNHLGNVVAGQDTVGTIMQVMVTSGVGILYAVIFLKSGTIWPTCIMHFVHNYICVSMSDGTLDVNTSPVTYSLFSILIDLALIAIYLLMTRMIVKGVARENILCLWKRKWGISTDPDVHPKRDITKSVLCSILGVAVITAGVFGINELTAHLYKDVLNCNGYYTVTENPDGLKTVTFYDGMFFSRNKQTIALAYGYGEIDCVMSDIDGDDDVELICSVSNSVDGSDLRYLVYKRIGDDIYVGTLIWQENFDIPESSELTILECYSLDSGEMFQMPCFVAIDDNGKKSYYKMNSDYIKYKYFDGFNTEEKI